ncbi:MAG: hypothetical protein Q8Q33_06000 [Chlamydiota bacterium]|nr:hypothetical protein [Chlamydiota bacterium]
MASIPESDWKYMSKIKTDLLNRLCEKIRKQSVAIFQEEDSSEYERYLKNYKHIQDSDKIVAECFNDWRRSTLFMRLAAIQHYELLSQEQFERLSVDTQKKLNAFRDI